MRNKLSLLLGFIFASVLLSFIPSLFADESITITTYYPSPYGSYNQLYVADKLGIGTTSPGVALEVAGQVKITGGSPGANKVLTSDANGLASWQTAGGGTPDYDSGWYAETNANHVTTLTHNLGVYPRRIAMWFSTTNPPSGYIYPMSVAQMNYPSALGNYQNPTAILLTTTQILLGFYNGSYLFSNYAAPTISTWYIYTSGYMRVMLWK